MIVMKHCSSEQLLLNSKYITITYHHIRTNACSKTDGAIFKDTVFFFVEREVHVSIHHTAYGKYTAIYLPEKSLTLFPTKSNILDMEERWQQVLQQ